MKLLCGHGPDTRRIDKMDISSTLRSVLIYAAIAVAGYFLGSNFTALFHNSSSVIGGFWSVISGVIVYDHIKLTGVTISVVMLVSVVAGNQDPIENAALRFLESVIGAGVAVSVTYLAGMLTSRRVDT